MWGSGWGWSDLPLGSGAALGLAGGCRGRPEVWGEVTGVCGVRRVGKGRKRPGPSRGMPRRTGQGRGRQGTLHKHLATGRSPRGCQGLPGTRFVLLGHAEGLGPEGAGVALGASGPGSLPARGGGDFIYNLCGRRAVSQPLMTHEGTANFCMGLSFACHRTIYNCPGERLRTTPGLPFPQAASPAWGWHHPRALICRAGRRTAGAGLVVPRCALRRGSRGRGATCSQWYRDREQQGTGPEQPLQ